MKTVPLPEIINPSRLALSGQEVVGSLKVSELTRLVELLSSDDGMMNCRVSAIKNQQGRILISGAIDAKLEMNCQLCIKPIAVDLEQEFCLLVVTNDEQAAEVLDSYEPLIVENDQLLLKQLFEDEAILALPIAVSHDLGVNCQQHKTFTGIETNTKQVETKQPFADLKRLMEQSSGKKD